MFSSGLNVLDARAKVLTDGQRRKARLFVRFLERIHKYTTV